MPPWKRLGRNDEVRPVPEAPRQPDDEAAHEGRVPALEMWQGEPAPADFLAQPRPEEATADHRTVEVVGKLPRRRGNGGAGRGQDRERKDDDREREEQA